LTVEEVPKKIEIGKKKKKNSMTHQFRLKFSQEIA